MTTAGETDATDHDSDESTSHSEAEEFSEFISSRWSEDHVETGMVIRYPLPFTDYLDTEAASAAATSDEQPRVRDDEGAPDDCASAGRPRARLPALTLSTVLEEEMLAPLFDGTQWAGTRVWKAAVLGLEWLLRQQRGDRAEGFGSLLELGCGLGVPGMVWKQALRADAARRRSRPDGGTGIPASSSPRVVLTDRASLIPQLRANVAANFGDDASIEAAALDWSPAGVASLLRAERETAADTTPSAGDGAAAPPAFDVCLNCDCVYEPLYGREAWESLADALAAVARRSPGTLLVTAAERRRGDGLEGFLERLAASGAVRTPIERVVRHDEDPHHVVEIYVTRGRAAA